MKLKNCLKMEYKSEDLQFIYDICDGLNNCFKDLLKGKFIPEISINNTDSSFKCFKTLHFTLFYVYKKTLIPIITIDYTGKVVDGSLKESIDCWKKMIISEIFKWVLGRDFLNIKEENGT